VVETFTTTKKNKRKKNRSIKKITKYDKIIVDGFELEVDGIFRKKEHFQQVLQRAIKLQTYSFEKKQRRQKFNKQISAGYVGPAYVFTKEDKHTPTPSNTFWGKQLPQLSRQEKRENLSHWMAHV